MKRILFTTLLLALVSVPSAAEKTRVAVVDFQAKGVPAATAQNVSELIRGEMINTGLYTVIERAQMGEILKEQGFQQAVCTDISCAVEMGKILSASKIMVGSVMKMGGAIIITGRIVDVQSGAGEFSESQEASSESDLYRAVKAFTARLSARIQGKAMEDMPVQPLPDKRLEDRSGDKIAGIYFARGTNPNGSTYSGTVTITKLANSYKFHWSIGPTAYDGRGVLKGKTLTVEWGDTYPVIYTVEDDGRLVGTWANGAGSETLTPER